QDLIDRFYYLLNLAIADIVRAKRCHDELEDIYSNAMDFNGVEGILKSILALL
ncbi:MAG: ATPase, partial [Clostridiales bacterium]|nr:ATPase [Clostridiales bacterium]